MFTIGPQGSLPTSQFILFGNQAGRRKPLGDDPRYPVSKHYPLQQLRGSPVAGGINFQSDDPQHPARFTRRGLFRRASRLVHAGLGFYIGNKLSDMGQGTPLDSVQSILQGLPQNQGVRISKITLPRGMTLTIPKAKADPDHDAVFNVQGQTTATSPGIEALDFSIMPAPAPQPSPPTPVPSGASGGNVLSLEDMLNRLKNYDMSVFEEGRFTPNFSVKEWIRGAFPEFYDKRVDQILHAPPDLQRFWFGNGQIMMSHLEGVREALGPIKITSGLRPYDPLYHGKGIAVDWETADIPIEDAIWYMKNKLVIPPHLGGNGQVGPHGGMGYKKYLADGTRFIHWDRRDLLGHEGGKTW